jgi:hypothetical protein
MIEVEFVPLSTYDELAGAGLEAADAPARCLIRLRVVGSALVLSSVSLFDLRPFLRSLIAATNASAFFPLCFLPCFGASRQATP